MDITDIKHEALELNEEMTKWRRFFHRHPETGFQLPRTKEFLQEKLTELGLNITGNYAESGLAAVVKGELRAENKRTLAIRADMDALNLQEETDKEYVSQESGKMHACGHDAHMAMALGAAKILQQNRDQFAGRVKFIFQPAEEIGQGAEAMLAEGVFQEEPVPDAVLGCHIGSLWSLPSGKVGYRKGPLMAAADMIEIKIKGKGGHGAVPHTAVDAIVTGAEVVSALQKIVSRKISPLDSVVISIGEFNAGSAFNIIAEEAHISGTVRTLNEDIRKRLPEMIEDVLEGVCLEMGADYELEYTYGPPVLENDSDFTEFFVELATEMLGEENVVEIPNPTMGGEDMAYFLQQVPGTFFGVGSMNLEKETDYPHHNPKFDIDEEVLWIGSALFVATALNWL